jgi:hypothetical protein
VGGTHFPTLKSVGINNPDRPEKCNGTKIKYGTCVDDCHTAFGMSCWKVENCRLGLIECLHNGKTLIPPSTSFSGTQFSTIKSVRFIKPITRNNIIMLCKIKSLELQILKLPKLETNLIEESKIQKKIKKSFRGTRYINR